MVFSEKIHNKQEPFNSNLVRKLWGRFCEPLMRGANFDELDPSRERPWPADYNLTSAGS